MTSAPPKIATSRSLPSNTIIAAALLTAAGAGIAAMVYFFNPSAYGFYPVCQFHQLTGLNCPGCGATRALYALLHGNFSAALHDNVLLVVGLAATAGRGSWFALNRLCGRPNGRFCPGWFIPPALVVLGVFGVLRNLPAFSFLSP